MFKTSKKSILLLMVMVLSLSIVGCKKEAKTAIAKVNGKEISRSAFDQEFEISKKLNGDQYKDEELKEMIYNMLVDEEIVGQDLERLEIAVTDKEVEEELDIFKEQMGDEAKYKEFLKENGFSEDYIKKDIRRKLMVAKHRDDFLNKVHLEEKEIKDFYEKDKANLEKVKLSHILAENKEEADKIIKRLDEEKVEFAKIVEEISADEKAKSKAGDLGYIKHGDLLQIGLGDLEEEAFKLKEGQHSKAIESQVGVHIVNVVEKLDSYEALKEDATNKLKFEKYKDAVKKLKEDTEIEVLDKEFK